MDRGAILWRVPHGETPDDIKNNPALKGLNVPRTGQAGSQGRSHVRPRMAGKTCDSEFTMYASA